MEVFISIDWLFDIYFLAKKWNDFKQRGKKQNFTIISFVEAQGRTPLYEDKLKICEEIGGNIIILDEVLDKIKPDDNNIFYAHTFGPTDQTLSVLGALDAKNIIAYADGYKNEIEESFLEKFSIREIFYFGWVHQKSEKLFKNINKISLLNFETIQNFAEYFRDKLNIKPISPPPDGLFLITRYWGRGPYTLTDGITYGQAVKKVLQNKNLYDFKTIIIKDDPRILEEEMEELITIFKKDGKQVKNAQEYINNYSDKIKFIPFEILLSPEFSNTTFFFDSSVGTALMSNTKADVRFLEQEDIKGVFKEESGPKTIKTYTDLYKNYAKFYPVQKEDEITISSGKENLCKNINIDLLNEELGKNSPGNFIRDLKDFQNRFYKYLLLFYIKRVKNNRVNKFFNEDGFLNNFSTDELYEFANILYSYNYFPDSVRILAFLLEKQPNSLEAQKLFDKASNAHLIQNMKGFGWPNEAKLISKQALKKHPEAEKLRQLVADIK